MKREFTDKETDSLIKGIVRDTAVDESELRDIADSPLTWWAVQREIAKQKETVSSPWPPVTAIWRWLIVGVPTLAAVALVVVFFAFRSTPTEQPIVDIVKPVDQTIQTPQTQDFIFDANPKTIDTKANGNDPLKPVAKQTGTRRPKPQQFRISQGTVAKKINKEKTEIRSDFIALSYARNPDSGQLVRVKVPRSMMVRLGLVASVEKPSDLIDAEVLVGDDGLSRAIRFIH